MALGASRGKVAEGLASTQDLDLLKNLGAEGKPLAWIAAVESNTNIDSFHLFFQSQVTLLQDLY